MNGATRSGALGEADHLARVPDVNAPDGMVLPRTLGSMLFNVPNHATHHRSEIATMLTMVSDSPTETGLNTYHWEKAKQQAGR